ncbi:hypothetical protein [Sulfurimonas sp.]|uniref:hypothetical protein n=1 Tax=Sulfurimonas sp. TaxID=2022749 RepID=UPI0025E4D48F|nr:hypothetical protein [Sulfurimonas sp.]
MNGFIKGEEVHFDDTRLYVKLEDDRIILMLIRWYELLKLHFYNLKTITLSI